ncbi:hypothetical protein PIB30_078339 [Stylosanthes scabra]|uniref:Uncharacterized protein n=1 Tax=Stylosanthes scabra TaxID=79078 RepID=A0ABU6WQI5_9FABA|nr:hypothetical protein [Stylosanthes scabra]
MVALPQQTFQQVTFKPSWSNLEALGELEIPRSSIPGVVYREKAEERLKKALEAKGSQEEAKKHEIGHRTTSRVLGSVLGCILPTPARPHCPIACATARV